MQTVLFYAYAKETTTKEVPSSLNHVICLDETDDAYNSL